MQISTQCDNECFKIEFPFDVEAFHCTQEHVTAARGGPVQKSRIPSFDEQEAWRTTIRPSHCPPYLVKTERDNHKGTLGTSAAEKVSYETCVQPFHLAALANNVNGLRGFLAQHGKSALEITTLDKRGAVEFAVRGGAVDVLKFLHEEAGIELDVRNEFGVSAIGLGTLNPDSAECVKYMAKVLMEKERKQKQEEQEEQKKKQTEEEEHEGEMEDEEEKAKKEQERLEQEVTLNATAFPSSSPSPKKEQNNNTNIKEEGMKNSSKSSKHNSNKTKKLKWSADLLGWSIIHDPVGDLKLAHYLVGPEVGLRFEDDDNCEELVTSCISQAKPEYLEFAVRKGGLDMFNPRQVSSFDAVTMCCKSFRSNDVRKTLQILEKIAPEKFSFGAYFKNKLDSSSSSSSSSSTSSSTSASVSVAAVGDDNNKKKKLVIDTTPIHSLASSGNVQILLEKFDEMKKQHPGLLERVIDTQSRIQGPPSMIAAVDAGQPALPVLLKNGANPDCLIETSHVRLLTRLLLWDDSSRDLDLSKYFDDSPKKSSSSSLTSESEEEEEEHGEEQIDEKEKQPLLDESFQGNWNDYVTRLVLLLLLKGVNPSYQFFTTKVLDKDSGEIVDKKIELERTHLLAKFGLPLTLILYDFGCDYNERDLHNRSLYQLKVNEQQVHTLRLLQSMGFYRDIQDISMANFLYVGLRHSDALRQKFVNETMAKAHEKTSVLSKEILSGQRAPRTKNELKAFNNATSWFTDTLAGEQPFERRINATVKHYQSSSSLLCRSLSAHHGAAAGGNSFLVSSRGSVRFLQDLVAEHIQNFLVNTMGWSRNPLRFLS